MNKSLVLIALAAMLVVGMVSAFSWGYGIYYTTKAVGAHPACTVQKSDVLVAGPGYTLALAQSTVNKINAIAPKNCGGHLFKLYS